MKSDSRKPLPHGKGFLLLYATPQPPSGGYVILSGAKISQMRNRAQSKYCASAMRAQRGICKGHGRQRARSSKRSPRFDFQKSAIRCRLLKVRLETPTPGCFFAQDDSRGGNPTTATAKRHIAPLHCGPPPLKGRHPPPSPPPGGGKATLDIQ